MTGIICICTTRSGRMPSWLLPPRTGSRYGGIPAPADDGLYYNIECSCIGKIYMCCGGDRHDREFLPEEAYRGIIREGSLGMEPFALREGPQEWEMRLVIPASTFVRHDIRSFRGLEARGNFYKCGDALPQRHYLSLFPVATLKPDFHRPEFFDKIIFSK